jgi:cyclopropane fatty-acyl-phospholipid synthase-like methyltransferase
MDGHATSAASDGQGDRGGKVRYYKRDFWGTENLKFAEPHFRMEKVARVLTRLANGRDCDLLDLGCGPAALSRLIPENVRYHGIDIAIQTPAPNLIEMDIVKMPISFRGMKFDLITAQGLFEYCGERQSQKFAEIKGLLKDGGKFVVTYMNFAHRKKHIYGPYSNVQQPDEFRRCLAQYFIIDRSFPSAYNWNHTMPNRKAMKAAQARLNINIPIISPMLAVDGIYICSPRV